MKKAATLAGMLAATLGVCFGASGAGSALDLPELSRGYRVKLDSFAVAPSQAAGLVARVRINSGPPLRLLLDSGADYVVLSRRAALKSGCRGGADVDLVGAGALSAGVAKQLPANTLEVGGLTLHGVPVLIAARPFTDGVEGVLPLSVFAGFLIRLDVSAKDLELAPYPAEPMDPEGALPVRSSNRVLFVEGTVNETRKGYFLLDTGASYTAISREVARQLKISDALAERVGLRGGVASMDAPLLSTWVRLRLGSRTLATGPVVAVDLSTASRYHSFEVAGLIGYTALSKSVLTVNYRDGLIRIEAK